MKTKKRITTLLLAVTLVLGVLVPLGNTKVWAADESASDYATLSDAIAAAPSGAPWTIEVIGDITYGTNAVLTIPAGKHIIIQSHGSTRVLKQSNGRHFAVSGELTLSDIILDGDYISGSATSGGVTVNSSGKLTAERGATIQNCFSSSGGGIDTKAASILLLDGAVIQNNTATTYGGGVYIQGSADTARIDNSTITGNKGTSNSSMGGGIYSEADLTVKNSTISSNEAVQSGGGIFSSLASPSSTLTLQKCTVADNKVTGVGGTRGLGGGISSNVGAISLTDCDILRNYAGQDGGGVHSGGKLTIDGSTIKGNEAPNSKGGGICSLNDVEMEDVIISGNSANTGGGVLFSTAATSPFKENTISVKGGEIFGNSADWGGGMLVNYYNTATITDVNIKNNKADTKGGGVFASAMNSPPYQSIAKVTITGNTKITGNTAGEDGGGVYVRKYDATYFAEVAVTGNTKISNNMAVDNGGGIYTGGQLDITGTVALLDNKAGDGGGIFTTETSAYANITTGASTVFKGNRASNGVYAPPTGADTMYPNLKYARVSINTNPLHPLNNYDINYTVNAPIATSSITYDPNGGTGSYVDEGVNGNPYIILSLDDTGISYSGYDFTGWNTKADGLGTAYAPGATFKLGADATLYAQWKSDSEPGTEESGTGGATEPPTDGSQPTEPPTGDSQPTEPSTGGTTSPPPTGDSSNMLIFILLGSGAAVVLVFLVRQRKRNMSA